MNNFEGLEAMNLEKAEFFDNWKGNSSASCSICFDLVVDRGERSIAKLQCGHEFHLDCIGSAFNAKGAMQCPNCRKVEKGRWLYASGHRSSSNFDFDAWVTEDFYDLSYSELPFGFQWCPLRGITQLASLIESGARGGSNVAASMGPSVMGEMRSHSHIHTSRRHGNNHIHQQSVPSSSPTSASFPPIRRSRPRALTLISSLSSTSSSAEIGGFYGFASVSSSANRTTAHQDAESMARHFDRFCGWGSREGLTPLPWIPLEGESQWWGPFNPSQAPQSGGSFFPRANITSERAGQSHRMPWPPPSFM